MVRTYRRDMALDVTIFQKISPSRFVSFTIPNPISPLSLRLLRVAVLDSPVVHPADSPPRVAAMLAPKHRESDWIFTTESGHLQLLLTLPDISRLVLIGDQPSDRSASPRIYRRANEDDDRDRERLQESLKPLVMALSPKNCFGSGISDIPFLSYEDNVVSSVELEKSVGPIVGEMLVEDVEIEIDGVREFRRRLRFKRMPNLVQTDTRIIPKTPSSTPDSSPLTGSEFSPDLTVLVHPYLAPMVAGLALISSHIDKLTRTCSPSRPEALCIGVGGGGLLSFLKVKLGFKVTGVEIDWEVLRVARRFFALEEDGDFVHVQVEDGIKFLGRFSDGESVVEARFDVLMVDLDSTDAMNGVSAPPVEFVSTDVLLAARNALNQSGILVINVIPPDKTFYDRMKDEFRQVFAEVYEIDVGNGENFVLIATVDLLRLPGKGSEADFVQKLRSVVPEKYMDAIRRI